MVVQVVLVFVVYFFLFVVVLEVVFCEVFVEWQFKFVYCYGGLGDCYMMEIVVGGVVFFDFDGDVDNDVFFVDGGELLGYDGLLLWLCFFCNDGGCFVDWMMQLGFDFLGYGSGVVVVDIDNDGDVDFYLMVYCEDVFFFNWGDGCFECVVIEELLNCWIIFVVFVDVDGDGNFDLFVVGYVDYEIVECKFCGDCENDVCGYCYFDVYLGMLDYYFCGDGCGGFVDSLEVVGVVEV